MESAGASTQSQKRQAHFTWEKKKSLENYFYLRYHHGKIMIKNTKKIYDDDGYNNHNYKTIHTYIHTYLHTYHKIIQLWKKNYEWTKYFRKNNNKDKKSKYYNVTSFKKSNKFLWWHNHNPFRYIIMDGWIHYLKK